MLTAAQQYAIDQFAKGLFALDDDALIDTYHQALEDLRAARAEGSENLSKAYAQTFATEKAMRDRFHDYRARYKMRTPEQTLPASPFRRTPSCRRVRRRLSHHDPSGESRLCRQGPREGSGLPPPM
jgi:hypothetical protein